MREHKTTAFLILLTMATVVVTSTATLRGGSQDSSSTKRQKEEMKYKQRLEFEKQFPVVDYDSPESEDPDKRTKRKIKNSRYDKSGFAIKDPSPHVGEESLESEWEVTALPVGQSDAVVTGEVVDAGAHLSNDKSGIYSEFTIRVDEVLKGTISTSLASGQSITVDRPGGFVEYPSGHKRLIRVMRQNMPRVGRRYVLFLNSSEPSSNYRILTGYESGPGGISPLDDGKQFDAYRGMEETRFLNVVRGAVTQPSQTPPND